MAIKIEPPPLILLAPMEGLLDFVLRDVLTRVGGVDRCVSEFIRVSGTVLPERVFLRYLPELNHGGRTLAGTPVRAQLLGSDPACMADNAAALAALGPEGIDLNFGCPAPVVNRHGGGAALLREPDRIAQVVAAVRRAVPSAMPVSAKMRLGYDDPALAVACAQAMAAAGACEIVVHARTKADGYRPPGVLGANSGDSRGSAGAGGGQRRNLDGARCGALPRAVWRQCADAGARHGGRPGPGAGTARARRRCRHGRRRGRRHGQRHGQR